MSSQRDQNQHDQKTSPSMDIPLRRGKSRYSKWKSTDSTDDTSLKDCITKHEEESFILSYYLNQPLNEAPVIQWFYEVWYVTWIQLVCSKIPRERQTFQKWNIPTVYPEIIMMEVCAYNLLIIWNQLLWFTTVNKLFTFGIGYYIYSSNKTK